MGISRDLEIGKTGENMVGKILVAAGIMVKNNGSRTKYYDLSCSAKFGNFTIEVKFDIYAAKTGNIAVEFFNPRQDRPSGIDMTKADIWAIALSNGDVYLSSVRSLREFIEKTKPKRIIAEAGDGNASLKLYDQDVILPIFTKINDLTTIQLTKVIKEML